jgi:N-acetylmuramoyl-L-alanine amidase
MRSFARTIAAACALAAVTSYGVAAQDGSATFSELLARDRELRREMELAPQRRAQPPGEASATLLRRIRGVVAGYEEIVRRRPSAAVADDATWNAAMLSADAFWQFGDSRDRSAAIRLFERLRTLHPASPFVPRLADHVKRLSAAPATSGATLMSIRRDVLPDALRITLELDEEAVFQETRSSGPPRVSLDLLNAHVVEALDGASLTFNDDVVRHAQVVPRPDEGVRVILDLQGAARHSVYSLYNPYRIVMDFERSPAAAAAAAAAMAARTARAAAAASAASPARVAAASAPPAPAPAARPSNASGVSLSRQLGLGVARIAIDPGHGGNDPGARVPGLNEAEVVLDIALRLEKLLRDEPGAEVVLTRRTNRYVALEERTAIANRAAADLFISIHVNASANASARGLETYFLNFAANPEAEAIAARENAGSARTMASLPEIVKAIARNNNIDESRRLASTVQAAMFDGLARIDRSARNLGVKQAPFMVLIGATMPSALVEVAFLTHEQEGALLRTQAYRQRVAEALRDGILEYQTSLKQTPQVAAQ